MVIECHAKDYKHTQKTQGKQSKEMNNNVQNKTQDRGRLRKWIHTGGERS